MSVVRVDRWWLLAQHTSFSSYMQGAFLKSLAVRDSRRCFLTPKRRPTALFEANDLPRQDILSQLLLFYLFLLPILKTPGKAGKCDPFVLAASLCASDFPSILYDVAAWYSTYQTVPPSLLPMSLSRRAQVGLLSQVTREAAWAKISILSFHREGYKAINTNFVTLLSLLRWLSNFKAR